MIDKRTTHYKEDLDHACTELKRQDNDLRHLRKRVGEKNLEIAELRAQAAELEAAARAVVRAAPPLGPLWFQSEQINRLSEAVINPQGKAFIARKQAEAVDKLKSELASDYPEKPYIRSILQSMGLRADSLRNDAGKAGGQ